MLSIYNLFIDMKTQDLKKAHAQTKAELAQRIAELEKELVATKLQIVSRQTTNVRSYKNMRHEVAKLKTILHTKSN